MGQSCSSPDAYLGANALQVRLFDRDQLIGGDILDDFADLFAWKTTDWRRPVDLNDSNSLEQLQLLRRLNRWFEKHHPNLQFSPFRDRLKTLIDQQKSGTRIEFSRDEYAAILQRYRSDLDWIEQVTRGQERPITFDRRLDQRTVEGNWRLADESPPRDAWERLLFDVIAQIVSRKC